MVNLQKQFERQDSMVKRGSDRVLRTNAGEADMTRSGYIDDEPGDYYHLFRASVDRAIKGKRGQAFLRELAEAMDTMPEKVLISDELINAEGHCCAIGVVCGSRGLEVAKVDCDDPWQVGGLVGIARSMAAEISYENDECGHFVKSSDGRWSWDETPEHRWTRMRKWVERNIVDGREL